MPEFPFRFHPSYRRLAAPFGVRPSNALVVVEGGELDARFGPWRVRTHVANVAGTTRTGPYRRLKTAGPPRLSLGDRGLTFATNPDAGLCMRFRSPVAGIDPLGAVRHPGLTVTVEDLDGLEAELRR